MSRPTSGFADAFDSVGNPVDAEATTGAGTLLLDQLAWWAFTLRAGRREFAYIAG